MIVDSVLAIRKGLTESQNKGETPAPSPRTGPREANGTENLKDVMEIPALNRDGNSVHAKLNGVI